MKTINKTSLLLALIILAIAFSIISMIAAPAEIRYSWHGLNPWNTIQAVPLMFKRFLKMEIINAGPPNWYPMAITIIPAPTSPLVNIPIESAKRS